MKPVLHILATVRQPELLQAAVFVFATLRTGFPTAEVFVWGNALPPASAAVLAQFAAAAGGKFHNLPHTSHDVWIEGLLARSTMPFWICDTDVAFWNKVEDWFALDDDVALAGRFEPAFDEEWTRTRHEERLHTCVMRFNPSALRAAIHRAMAKIPPPWGHSGEFPMVRQTFVPVRGQATRFYDTCSGIWHAGIGTAFTGTQNECFDHLNFATYVDLIAPHLRGIAGDISERFAAIYAQPELARGIRADQDEYYAARQPKELHAV